MARGLKLTAMVVLGVRPLITMPLWACSILAIQPSLLFSECL
jgi:hypothetical protein